MMLGPLRVRSSTDVHWWVFFLFFAALNRSLEQLHVVLVSRCLDVGRKSLCGGGVVHRLSEETDPCHISLPEASRATQRASVLKRLLFLSLQHVHVHVLPRKAGDFERNDSVYDEVSVWMSDRLVLPHGHPYRGLTEVTFRTAFEVV